MLVFTVLKVWLSVLQYQQKEVGKNSTVYGNKTTAPSIAARKSSTLNYLITLDFTKETGSDDIWTFSKWANPSFKVHFFDGVML